MKMSNYPVFWTDLDTWRCFIQKKLTLKYPGSIWCVAAANRKIERNAHILQAFHPQKKRVLIGIKGTSSMSDGKLNRWRKLPIPHLLQS